MEKTKLILIGLSGGPDSLCLLHLARECGLKIVAAHLDHGLRERSAQDAEIVAELCASQQTELISKRIDVRDYSRQHKMTIEEAARSVRYRFLFDTANQIGAQAVLVAHHADDQVETVLMHLLRGTGVAGLRGMQMKLLPNSWSDKIPLVRPLLKTWRFEILDYCREHALEPIQDETNQDTRIHRNRIRQELIPELETYNLKFKQNLLKTIEIIQSEEVYLENQLIEIREELVRQRGKEDVMFNQAGFMSLSPALQRRLLRALIQEVNSSVRDIEFDLVERAREFVANGNSSNSIQLFNGMEIFRYRHDSIVIGKGNYAGFWPRLTINVPVSVSVPDTIEIGGGYRFDANRSQVRELDASPWTAVIDSEKVTGQLYLRTFKPGDRFMPYGLKGRSQKLGDFWTNEGLPKQARASWPLLCDDQGIVWVPGFRIADRCQVTSVTNGVIKFVLVRNENTLG